MPRRRRRVHERRLFVSSDLHLLGDLWSGAAAGSTATARPLACDSIEIAWMIRTSARPSTPEGSGYRFWSTQSEK